VLENFRKMADDKSKSKYKLATDEDFDAFEKSCHSDEGWSICFEDGTTKVWDQKSDKSAINVVKLFAVFSDVDADTLYDTLHDPDYRSVWDEHMVEGYNIEQLNATNDIGYYSAKSPGIGISNRDFLNQRMWRISSDGNRYIIMNHTVEHPKCPEKKGFVRACSIRTGYLVEKNDTAGCKITYLTQTDPKGWIPAWLVNKVTKTFAPKIVERLRSAALGYQAWKQDHKPDHKPWRET